ncbi:MAG: Lacal_2735 family protein [Flavobacteriales bacterium]|nr:Lacal_2735 family protein [Flavobacteriales bacterium]
MLGLFKRKSRRQQLEERYRSLLAEAHALSTRDRKASDLKQAEAERVLKQLEALPEE